MIERLRNLSLPRRHPRSEAFSRYVEGDLDARERRALESHLGSCPRCQRELASLENMVHALGSLEPETPSGLADSIITALRAERPPEGARGRRAPDAAGLTALTVVARPGLRPAGEPIRRRWPREAHAALRWCLQRPQLRLTLPITLVAGVVLSLVNMGGMLMHGKIDLGVCISCSIDFLVPFLALNLGLLLLRLPGRNRDQRFRAQPPG